MGRQSVFGWLIAAGTVAAGALAAPDVKGTLRKVAVRALVEGLTLADRGAAWVAYTREEWEDLVAQARYRRTLTKQEQMPEKEGAFQRDSIVG